VLIDAEKKKILITAHIEKGDDYAGILLLTGMPAFRLLAK
jgi:hypothetical protein